MSGYVVQTPQHTAHRYPYEVGGWLQSWPCSTDARSDHRAAGARRCAGTGLWPASTTRYGSCLAITISPTNTPGGQGRYIVSVGVYPVDTGERKAGQGRTHHGDTATQSNRSQYWYTSEDELKEEERTED